MRFDNVFLRRLNADKTIINCQKKYYPGTFEDAIVPVYMIVYNNLPVWIIQYKLLDEDNNNFYWLEKIIFMDLMLLLEM